MAWSMSILSPTRNATEPPYAHRGHTGGHCASTSAGNQPERLSERLANRCGFQARGDPTCRDSYLTSRFARVQPETSRGAFYGSVALDHLLVVSFDSDTLVACRPQVRMDNFLACVTVSHVGGLHPLSDLYWGVGAYGFCHSPREPWQVLFETVPEVDSPPRDPVLMWFGLVQVGRGCARTPRTPAL